MARELQYLPVAAGQRLGPPAAQGPAGFQLLWPTVEEIQNSIEGWAAGSKWHTLWVLYKMRLPCVLVPSSLCVAGSCRAC